MTDALSVERVVESVLAAGLVVSTLLLVTGLATGTDAALRLGILILMATPVARVAVLAIGLLARRDFVFGALSLFVLAVLALGIVGGVR